MVVVVVVVVVVVMVMVMVRMMVCVIVFVADWRSKGEEGNNKNIWGEGKEGGKKNEGEREGGREGRRTMGGGEREGCNQPYRGIVRIVSHFSMVVLMKRGKSWQSFGLLAMIKCSNGQAVRFSVLIGSAHESW